MILRLLFQKLRRTVCPLHHGKRDASENFIPSEGVPESGGELFDPHTQLFLQKLESMIPGAVTCEDMTDGGSVDLFA